MRAIQIKFCFFLACLSVLAALRVVSAAETDPQKATASPDDTTVWYDCKDLVVEGKGWTDTKSFYDRLPAKAEGKVPPSVWGLSHHSAGMCVPFTTDAPSIQVRWSLLPNGNLSMPHMPATGVSGVDLYSKDKSGRWSFVANGRPAGVDQYGQVLAACRPAVPAVPAALQWRDIRGDRRPEGKHPFGSRSGCEQAAQADRDLRHFHYPRRLRIAAGHGLPGDHGPATGYPGHQPGVQRQRKDGAGHGGTAWRNSIRRCTSSIACGTCRRSLVSTRIEPFVKTLRAARPDTPIVLAEDCSVRNVCPTEKGTILRKIHQKLTAEGVKNLHFLSNEGMLGDDTEGTVDGCHPNDLGMMRQAEVFAKALSPLLANGK